MKIALPGWHNESREGKIIRILALFVFLWFFYEWGQIMLAEGQSTTTTTIPLCTSMPIVIDSHRCIHVVKGTPHFASGTVVGVVVQEDKR